MNVDYQNVAKRISREIRRRYYYAFIKNPNNINDLYYNVQLYYFLCLKILKRRITDYKYLYNYEYDIIVENVMKDFRSLNKYNKEVF